MNQISKIIIITQSLKKDPCDCVWQTALQIHNRGIEVDVVWLGDRLSLGNILFNSRKLNKNKIQEFKMVKFLPFERFEIIKKINTLISLFLILSRQKKNTDKVFWIFEPFPFLGLQWLFNGKKIYDCIDNFSVISPEIEKAEKQLIEWVDAVFACNNTLFKELQKKTDNVYQVEQGFDLNSFQISDTSLQPKPFKNPLTFIFSGTICTRLDFPLLNSVIENQLADKFIFVGPIVKDFQPSKTFDNDIKKLFSFKNVEYLGVKSRSEIAEMIRSADACLIPYDVKKPFNTFSLPLKTLEYFYFGLPVFATPTPEMNNLKELVFPFETGQQFNGQVELVKKKGWSQAYRKRQRQFAVSQSWEVKVQHMLSIINP